MCSHEGVLVRSRVFKTGRRLRPIFLLFGIVGGVVATASPAMAQDLVYEPINPSFGGNPFNSAHLLGIANAQNDFTDPDSSRGSSSQADIFARQLQSRLLSALSSQIVDAIFGENPQQQGTISFGGQTIDFFRDLDSVTLNITNDETGEVTEIVIPTFIEVN
jgi:curli production assembly/transport component CsgF